MDGENFKPEDQADGVPGAELTDEQKQFQEKAKEAGWTEKTAFDYTEHVRDAARDAEWLGAAEIYTFDTEQYGEVGPPNPELERQLFQGEFQQRKGQHMGALNLEVAIDGPVLLHIKEVSIEPKLNYNIHSGTDLFPSSRRQAFTRSWWRT